MLQQGGKDKERCVGTLGSMTHKISIDLIQAILQNGKAHDICCIEDIKKNDIRGEA